MHTDSKILKYKSYAKINLFLYIKYPPKKNGYHNVLSLYHKINLYDRLSFEIGKGLLSKNISSAEDLLSIYIKKGSHYISDIAISEIIKNPNGNLIYKALDTLIPHIKKHYKNKYIPRVHINLIKNIPPSGGLGGGSSNAATSLMAFNKIYNLNLSNKKLMKIASLLGADTPFFLMRASSAIAKGIGDKLKAVKAKHKYHFALVFPDRGVSTQKAYKVFDNLNDKNILQNRQQLAKSLNKQSARAISQKNPQKMLKLCKQSVQIGDPKILANYIYNNLQEASKIILPDLQNILKTKVKPRPLKTFISGSGSTCVFLSNSKQDAKLIKNNLARKNYLCIDSRSA